MQLYSFLADGPVDHLRFDKEWESQRLLNLWPPAEFTLRENLIRAVVDSNNVPEEQLRKMLNIVLSQQDHRLLQTRGHQDQD